MPGAQASPTTPTNLDPHASPQLAPRRHSTAAASSSFLVLLLPVVKVASQFLNLPVSVTLQGGRGTIEGTIAALDAVNGRITLTGGKAVSAKLAN